MASQPITSVGEAAVEGTTRRRFSSNSAVDERRTEATNSLKKHVLSVKETSVTLETVSSNNHITRVSWLIIT